MRSHTYQNVVEYDAGVLPLWKRIQPQMEEGVVWQGLWVDSSSHTLCLWTPSAAGTRLGVAVEVFGEEGVDQRSVVEQLLQEGELCKGFFIEAVAAPTLRTVGFGVVRRWSLLVLIDAHQFAGTRSTL